jgi:hypothetical protein
MGKVHVHDHAFTATHITSGKRAIHTALGEVNSNYLLAAQAVPKREISLCTGFKRFETTSSLNNGQKFSSP